MPNQVAAARLRLLMTFSLLFLFGVSTPSFATGNIVKSDLKGTWRIALRGSTTCGFVSMLATVTLGTTGSGTGTLQIHGECGDQTLTPQTFTVKTLAINGTGKATLTCGPSCVWTFDIQVAEDRSKFNLVNVLGAGVFLEGVGILSSPAGNIVVPDLKGEWQLTLFGETSGLCGDVAHVFTISAAGTLVLNTSGSGTMNASYHTTCGDADEPSTFTILGLNADGSGTAMLGCPEDECADEVSIQVSPDRSTFSFVTVSPAATGSFFAGVAIRKSTAGHIVMANLAGAWRAALGGEESGGTDSASTLATFTLNASGVSNNLTIRYHVSDDGDGTVTGTLTIQTLNPDGSGTVLINCGVDCEKVARIQVSPERSMFSIVDVSTADEFTIGTAIHR